MRKRDRTQECSTQNSRVEELIGMITKNLKTMVDTKMVVGDEIETKEVTLIPISKVTVGFVAGGGEYDKFSEADTNPAFAGGSGAGYSVNPIGFIVIKGNDVKLIKVAPNELAGKIVETLPEVVEAINKYFAKEK